MFTNEDREWLTGQSLQNIDGSAGIRLIPDSIAHDIKNMCDEAQIDWEGKRHVRENNLANTWPLLYVLFQEVERLGYQERDEKLLKLLRANYALLNNEGPVVKNSVLTMLFILSGGDNVKYDVDKLLKSPPVYNLNYKTLISHARFDKMGVYDFLKGDVNRQVIPTQVKNYMSHMEFHQANVMLGLMPGSYPLRCEGGRVLYYDEWCNPIFSDAKLPTTTHSAEITLRHRDVEELGQESVVYNQLLNNTTLFILKPIELGSHTFLFTTLLTREGEKEPYLRHEIRITFSDSRETGLRVTNIGEELDLFYNTQTMRSDDLFDQGQDFIWFNDNENELKQETSLSLPKGFSAKGRLLANVICYNPVENAYFYGTRANIPTAVIRMGLQRILQSVRAETTYTGEYTPMQQRVVALNGLLQDLKAVNVLPRHEVRFNHDAYNVGNDTFHVECKPDAKDRKGVYRLELGCVTRVDRQPSWMQHVYRMVLFVRQTTDGDEVFDFELKTQDAPEDATCVFTPACIESVSNYLTQLFTLWIDRVKKLPPRAGQPPSNMSGM